jgi:hypothetical protein
MVHRAHWGREDRDPPMVRSAYPETWILARIAAAWIALLGRGDAGGAVAAAREAGALAADHGYALKEVVARGCEAVALLASEAGTDEVAAGVAAFAAGARDLGLGAHVAEAELLALLVSPAAFDPARVAAIASGPSPVAARRARGLLGEAVTLDRADEAVVRAARRRVGCRVVSVVARAAGRDAGWMLDERARRVWLGERAVSLEDRPLLWRILAVIADAGGAVDKEALVVRAWTQRDYHPLRDDARLHTAIRALRRLIEDDPGRPARLVTTEDGYAFGREAPVWRVVSATAPV